METFCIGLIIFIVCGGIWGYYNEKRLWNRGHCSICGSIWKSFDMDSSGAVGFKCEGKHYIWISWHSIFANQERKQ